LFVFV